MTCDKCRDTGFYTLDVPAGHPRFGEAIPCPCKKSERDARRAERLLRMDGLTSTERNVRFDNLKTQYDNGIEVTLYTSTIVRQGLITLIGPPGVGKSTLLFCVVNAIRDDGELAIYTTVSDLLSYLRSTFRPDAEVDFDEHWDALIRCKVLALDEMDEFNTTPWAMERFLRLIDERWRRMDEVLTVCATNSSINALPPKVASRLRDGRAQVITVKGHDMRPLNRWE